MILDYFLSVLCIFYSFRSMLYFRLRDASMVGLHNLQLGLLVLQCHVRWRVTQRGSRHLFQKQLLIRCRDQRHRLYIQCRIDLGKMSGSFLCL